MNRNAIGVFGYLWALFPIFTVLYSGLTTLYVFFYLLITFFLIYFVFAPQNLFFTIVDEGTSKFVDEGGEIIATLLQWVDHDISHQPDGDIEEGVPKKKCLGLLGPWNITGGLWFYGLWPIRDINTWQFQWSDISPGGEVVHHDKRLVDYLMVKLATYYQMMKKAESADLVPLIIEVILSIYIKNPYKARFKIQNWLSSTFERTLPLVRDAVSQENYEDLQKRKDSTKELGDTIYQSPAIQKGIAELEKDMGTYLAAIGIKDLNPTEEYRKETLRAYEAKRAAEAKIITATADAQAMVLRAGGEAEAIKTRNEAIQKFGDLGKFLELIQASKEPGDMAKIIQVHLIPGLTEVLQKKENISEEDLNIILQFINSKK